MRLTLSLLALLLIFPNSLIAETLILNDGSKIETNYYWRDGGNVGYFQDGKEKYISNGQIDWDATKSLKRGTPVRSQSATPKPTKKESTSEFSSHMHAKYEGRGDDVINITKPEIGHAAILSISGNRAERHFSVSGFSDSGKMTKLLVNTTSSYDGFVLIDMMKKADTTSLEIKTTGKWIIAVFDLGIAAKLKRPGRMEGSGDSVIILTKGDDTLKIGGNKANKHFMVMSYSILGTQLLVNTTEKYSGRVRVSKEPLLLEIKATGTWMIDS